MVLSSMQLQKVSVILWFRRLQRLLLRSVLSVFINLHSAECVGSYYGLRVCSQTNKSNYMHVKGYGDQIRFKLRYETYRAFESSFAIHSRELVTYSATYVLKIPQGQHQHLEQRGATK